MFHLKFRKVDAAEKAEIEINVSCPAYEKLIRKDVAIITVHKGYTLHDGHGVDYQVSDDPHAYDVCFVTNEAGKTVDRIGPFPVSRG